MKLLRDKSEILSDCTWIQVYAYIHKHHSYSTDHALKYEGYEVQNV